MYKSQIFGLCQRPAFIARALGHRHPVSLPFSQYRVRQASYYYRGSGGSYKRFQQGTGLLRRWAASPTFYYQVAGLSGVVGVVYVYNLEEVPVSGRRRFNIISVEQEVALSKQMYAEIMNQYRGKILSNFDGRTRMVQRVLNRLISASGMQDLNWEVHVIDDPQKNAFVIPGGKVFVFSGILPICQNDDGLAAVLGHEIAHTVAHHAAERMSQAAVFITPIDLVLRILFQGDAIAVLFGSLLLDLGFSRPGSRKQETEADYIGLMMMAQSCYDPEAAVDLWARMEKAAQGEPPQFLSTHPSSHNRQERIKEWLPEAENKRAESECGSTLGYAEEFRKAFKQPVW